MIANIKIKGFINPISVSVYVGLSLLSVVLYAVDVISTLTAAIGMFVALFCGAAFRIADQWGITCQTVGIKDIVIPSALTDAMSKQAQAERERQARIILGTAETEISEKFAKAAKNYQNDPVALQLRGMNMLFEGLKEKGSLIIVPSSALESMNLGAVGGLAALAQTSSQGQKLEDLKQKTDQK